MEEGGRERESKLWFLAPGARAEDYQKLTK